MAELIERMLAALIVILLMGIVLYLLMVRTPDVQRQTGNPATETRAETQYARKTDSERLPQTEPSEFKRDWSRSPTIVVKDREPQPVYIKEKPRRDYRRQYRREYRQSYREEEYRPVTYRDRRSFTRYHDEDCVGADCTCSCDRPYWSHSGPICYE